MATNGTKKSLEEQYIELINQHPELKLMLETIHPDDNESLAQPSPFKYIESTTTAGAN